MLKLVKLDLLQGRREFFNLFYILMAVSFVMGIVTYPTLYQDNFLNSDSYSLLFSLVLIVYQLLPLLFLMIVCLRVYITYKNNMFTKNGYLYHTLPVKTWQLILSKILSSFLWTLIASLFMGICYLLYVIGALVGMFIVMPKEVVTMMGGIDWEYSLRYIFRSILNIIYGYEWIEFIIKALVLDICSTSLVFTLLTLNYSTLMQNLNRFLRYAIWFIIAIVMLWLFITGVTYYVKGVMDMYEIIIDILGIAGFFVTVWLIDHKVDVNC